MRYRHTSGMTPARKDVYAYWLIVCRKSVPPAMLVVLTSQNSFPLLSHTPRCTVGLLPPPLHYFSPSPMALSGSRLSTPCPPRLNHLPPFTPFRPYRRRYPSPPVPDLDFSNLLRIFFHFRWSFFLLYSLRASSFSPPFTP